MSTETVTTENENTEAEGGNTEAANNEATASSENLNSEPGPNESSENTPGEKSESVDYSDFKLPEDVQLDSVLLEKAKPIFEKLNLTKDQAQELVDFQAQQMQDKMQGDIDAFEDLKTTWLDDARADNEIGGENFDETIAGAKLFIDKFGTDELRSILNETGVGNHKEVIRAFSRAAKLMKEDSPNVGGQPQVSKKDRATILYGNSE